MRVSDFQVDHQSALAQVLVPREQVCAVRQRKERTDIDYALANTSESGNGTWYLLSMAVSLSVADGREAKLQ